MDRKPGRRRRGGVEFLFCVGRLDVDGRVGNMTEGTPARLPWKMASTPELDRLWIVILKCSIIYHSHLLRGKSSTAPIVYHLVPSPSPHSRTSHIN